MSDKETLTQVEIEGDRIDVRCLMRAIGRIQSRRLDVGHQWGEEGDSDIWTANAEHGSPNDREWDTIASAPTLVKLLAKLGS